MSKFSRLMLLGLLFTVLLSPQLSVAKIDVYPFTDKALEKRFIKLIEELRCPKCQNNNLAGSNSGIAKDLKDLVYEKVLKGESDQQIIDYLKARYGDFVSYDPPLNSRTWVIWYGPWLLLITGMSGIIIYSRKRSLNSKATSKTEISEENLATLTQWANDQEPNNSDAKNKKASK